MKGAYSSDALYPLRRPQNVVQVRRTVMKGGPTSPTHTPSLSQRALETTVPLYILV